MLRTASWALPMLCLLGSNALGQTTVAVPDSVPSLRVFEGTAHPPGIQGIPADNGRVDFGAARVGQVVSKVFTVKNVGLGPVALSDSIKLPAGFTQMRQFGKTTLAPGESTTVVLALNSARPGRLGGQASLRGKDGQTNLFRFHVAGSALAPPSMRIVGLGDVGFRTVGKWAPVTTSGKNALASVADGGKGKDLATWTFSGLQPGRYIVSATWPASNKAAANAPFTVLNGSKPFKSISVDQTRAPADFRDAGTSWKKLGEPYFITGDRLVVQLSNNADGQVLADTVRIERVNYAGKIMDNRDQGFSTLGTWDPLGTGFQGDSRVSAGNGQATWTFKDLKPGLYRVSVTWPQLPGEDPAMAGYTILDGNTVLGRAELNQRHAPKDLHDAATNWKDLGGLGALYRLRGDTLVVRLSSAVTGGIVADAVRIENTTTPSAPVSDADIVRFLEQATFGPNDASIGHIRDDLGGDFSAYLAEQFALDPSSYPTLPLRPDNQSLTCPNTLPQQERDQCTRNNFSAYPIQTRFFVNAMYGPDQVRQRMSWALHHIVVTSAALGDLSHPSRMTPYLQIFDNNLNYLDILYYITLNPAMGRYLDMATSTRQNPNENYAREILQLFSIGLFQLNPDGSYRDPLTPTYDQSVVEGFAKAFTGWSFDRERPEYPGARNYLDFMVVRTPETNFHDRSQKLLLRGEMLPANQSAQQDLDGAHDNIFRDPSLAPYICKNLIQQFVTSNPTPGYVARVSRVFDDDGTGVKGNLAAVMYAILLDPEARGDIHLEPNYGHLREPALLLTGLLRAFNATGFDGTGQSDGYVNPQITGLDQDVFRPSSVFSYYSPDNELIGLPGVLGPEFQIFSTVTSLRRANFFNNMLRNGVPKNTTNPFGPAPNGTKLDVSAVQALSDDPDALVSFLDRILLHGTMSDDMRIGIVDAVSAVAASNPFKRAWTAVYLVGSSSQYQVQR